MSIKSKIIFRNVLLSGSAIVSFAPGLAIAQQADGASAAGSEIIVTAQRREERAQDVPIMITAISPDGLRERSVTSLQSLQNQVPSLIVAPNGQTTREVMSPSIRGQGTSFQGSPGVVVYMNEVPLVPAATLSSQGGPGAFVDLQSVQVLSGAQGTLFGRNTTGGAVLLTTARPTDKLEGSLSVGFGNYNMKELEAVVNVPLTDKLAIRVVGAGRQRDGFTQDLNWNKDRDNENWRMGRIGIQWDPTEAISSYTMASYSESSTNGTGNIPKSFNTATMSVYGMCDSTGLPACSDYDDLITRQKELGVRKVEHGTDGFYKSKYWTAMNNSEIELADNLKLRNIISYSGLKIGYANDADGSIANLSNTGNTRLSRGNWKDDFTQLTEEFQIQGDALGKKLIYTAGIFYSSQKPGGPMRDFATTNCVFWGETASEECSGFRDVKLSNKTTALFAQATLDLGAFTPALDRLRLTGGFRYNWDTVAGTAVVYSPYLTDGNVTCSFNGASVAVEDAFKAVDLVNPAAGGCGFSGTSKSKASTWTIGLDYQPMDNLLLYAKVSRGYKAGGFNGYAVNVENAKFGPEFMTDYEAGFKYDFTVGGRAARLNVNGFNMDYSKIQRGLPDINSLGIPGAVIRNAPSALIRGVEVEAMIKPVDGLEIGGNYSYIDAKYKSYNFPSPFAVPDCKTSAYDPAVNAANPKIMDLSCIPLQYMSPHIFSVYGRLNVPVPESVGDVNLFVSYAWADKQHTAPGALEYMVDNPTQIWEPGITMPSYGLLSASLNWNNFLQSGLDVSLFGTNLTNSTYTISNTGTFNIQMSQTQIYGEPRMFGIRMKYNFEK